jgi:hypothetical protein
MVLAAAVLVDALHVYMVAKPSYVGPIWTG